VTGSLGRLVEHDPASRSYQAARATTALKKVSWVRVGGPFDQGDLGSCTGNAVAGVMNTRPFHNATKPLLAETDAVKLYELATRLDNAPGQYPPDDTGSSGLAACKAAKRLGYITGYRHAFGIQHALEALQLGPVITGVNWYEGFDKPLPSGLVEITGQVRGGHEFEVYGYDPATDLCWAWNSWGKSWGYRGRFCFTSKTWGQLLAERGDVTVPERRPA
jgi:hypothetical protein